MFTTAIYRWSHGPNWHPPPVATLSLSCAATTTCLVLQLVCFQIYAQYHARIRSHRHHSRAVSTFQYYAYASYRTFKSSLFYDPDAMLNFMNRKQNIVSALVLFDNCCESFPASLKWKDPAPQVPSSPVAQWAEPLQADGRNYLGLTTFCRHWIKCLYWSWNSVVDKNQVLDLSAKELLILNRSKMIPYQISVLLLPFTTSETWTLNQTDPEPWTFHIQ